MSDQPPAGPAGSGAFARRAGRIAAEVLLPAAMQVESSGRVPKAHLDLLAAEGLYGMAGPADSGGLDVDFAEACAAVEVLAGACLSTTFVWLQHHGAVRAVAASGDARLRREWLRPLCLGARRAGVALGGTLPGPPRLRAAPAPGGYAFDGVSPWVTGWGYIDTLHTAARTEDGTIVWALLDASTGSGLTVEPLDMVAVMASSTVQARFDRLHVPAGRITGTLPFERWAERDAAGLRMNGSLALGVAGRCCQLIGPGPLDGELAAARAALDAGTAQTMPAARAAACELAIRAAAALVVTQGSTAILAGADAQRLAREALFLLVFGSRPPIKEALAGLLTGRSSSS
ncbi:MAG TPA: acyl-CoA dehydrogenase family protein [Streptosporangiaceae bacterium]|nr:acyl-CoA dehydrogenase family protein [Streptosporangiaceae bacterium]